MLTPEERGPQAAWAYVSRDLLGISPEQVVAILGRYDPATIRKAETNDRHMSRPIWRALTALYPKLAHERGIPIPIPPVVVSGPGASSTDQAALVAAINDLVALLRPIVEQAADREARLRAVEAELQSLRDRPTTEGSPGRSAQQVTAG